MSAFTTDYLILVFVATLGIIQVSASSAQLAGLLLFKSSLRAKSFGTSLILAAFIWFFSTDVRNINDSNGGLDANSQAFLFFCGSLAGVLFTLVASTVFNLRMNRSQARPEFGLDALKQTNYARALRRSLIYWWKAWSTRTNNYFCG